MHALNKSDLLSLGELPSPAPPDAVLVSGRTGAGMGELLAQIEARLGAASRACAACSRPDRGDIVALLRRPGGSSRSTTATGR